ncbi:glycosyltransferase family 2 protein [Microbacterium capsulatum]|uniref:Glycosyltransferase family 2 protein n=1 Tax=Microbacterium capsulatum TaxID=3041921 RepID=A0ABU0XGN0_9MICO|nr:glycosyltransferase family 2 protein [Microbacterium sp. ASV81]MDQ4214276.1 glycosyltransferase family 2 protein [Microbacterium sp. ASV81]
MSVDVAVVVVTYNSEEHVSALLDSVPAALGDAVASVVVVDNGSTDRTLEILDARDDCTVVRSTNVGYAGGMNRAVAESPPARAILILNPDAALDAGAVPRMLTVLDRPGVGIVAPRVREADGGLSPTLRRAPTLGRVGGLSFTQRPAFAERIEDPAAYETEHDVDWAVGAILLVDSDCYRALGGMDESFFLYSEETDLSLRAADAGWSTRYTPDAGAVHVGGGSGESSRTHVMKILNRIRLYRRRSGPVRGALYFWLSVGVEVRRGVFGRGRSWTAVRALLKPSERPDVLGLGDRLIPR